MEKVRVLPNGQWILEESPTINNLNKTAAAVAALATALNTTPVNNTLNTKKTIQPRPDLHHIAYIESSSGKNKDHKRVTWGLNSGHKAAGSYGLMPITILETINKNPNLKTKYGHLNNMHPDSITSYINSNDNADTEIANAHWDRLSKKFPKNEMKRAYAWKNGITGAARADKEELSQHPYVKAFIGQKYQPRSLAGAKDPVGN